LTESYTVDHSPTGKNGLKLSEQYIYQAIVLDLNLPDMSGLEVCQQLRKKSVAAPILILSGESKIISKITLLDAGANDYLTKPFSLGELKARLRVLIRHAAATNQAIQHFASDELMLDPIRHQVERNGMVIKLRRKEFSILECLMQHAGSIVTRDTLMSHAWRDNEDPWTNTVDVHIKYLRDKIDRPFDRPLIKTVHGLGYKLETSRRVAIKK
jgi:two-component system OmpR family response regulator